MADEIEFVNGLIVKPPHANAPDFVKCAISIKIDDLKDWLENRPEEEWINIDVKESKGGKWYAAVSHFRPKQQNAPQEQQQAPAPAHGGDFNDDIPFAPIGRGAACHSI